MRTTQQFSITLPLDMAEVIEGKIESGASASVSEVVRDGVRALACADGTDHRMRHSGSSCVEAGIIRSRL